MKAKMWACLMAGAVLAGYADWRAYECQNAWGFVALIFAAILLAVAVLISRSMEKKAADAVLLIIATSFIRQWVANKPVDRPVDRLVCLSCNRSTKRSEVEIGHAGRGGNRTWTCPKCGQVQVLEEPC